MVGAPESVFKMAAIGDGLVIADVELGWASVAPPVMPLMRANKSSMLSVDPVAESVGARLSCIVFAELVELDWRWTLSR